jgi:hypothetical protein
MILMQFLELIFSVTVFLSHFFSVFLSFFDSFLWEKFKNIHRKVIAPLLPPLPFLPFLPVTIYW